MRDRGLLYAAALLRSLGIGMTGVLAGLYLAHLGLGAASLGLVIAAGLAGGAVASLVATVLADALGRRRFLVAQALLAAAGGVGVALSSHAPALAAFAFVGMTNGMGRDRGAALVLEQAVLPATVEGAGRTRAFAWYNVLQDAGHALGALLAAAPELLAHAFGLDALLAMRAAMLVPPLLALVSVALYLALSDAVEHATGPRRVAPSPEARALVTRIAALFALDGLGGGFLTTSLLSFFFFERFGVSAALLGPMFFAARLLNALSHLGAAWLAGRIGLVRTMVFTHIPSSLLLIAVAWAPSFAFAAVLFLLREVLVEMDVPTRQSYVMAVVKPGERTFASGVTSLVRLGAWAVGPAFAGVVMQGVALATPLFAGAGMKIAYDLLLWRAFHAVRPPEERSA